MSVEQISNSCSATFSSYSVKNYGGDPQNPVPTEEMFTNVEPAAVVLIDVDPAKDLYAAPAAAAPAAPAKDLYADPATAVPTRPAQAAQAKDLYADPATAAPAAPALSASLQTANKA